MNMGALPIDLVIFGRKRPNRLRPIEAESTLCFIYIQDVNTI